MVVAEPNFDMRGDGAAFLNELRFLHTPCECRQRNRTQLRDGHVTGRCVKSRERSASGRKAGSRGCGLGGSRRRGLGGDRGPGGAAGDVAAAGEDAPDGAEAYDQKECSEGVNNVGPMATG